MARLEELSSGTHVDGVVADGPVEVVNVKWFGDGAVELTASYRGCVSNPTAGE